MARKSPDIRIIEVSGDKFKSLEDAQKFVMKSENHALARGIAETVKKMIDEGVLKIKDGKIISSHKEIQSEKQILVDIYGLIDPRTNEVMYVVQTRDTKARLKHHRYHPDGKVKGWTEELRSCGLKPTMRILETVSLKDADKTERKWITELHRTKNLLNSVFYSDSQKKEK